MHEKNPGLDVDPKLLTLQNPTNRDFRVELPEPACTIKKQVSHSRDDLGGNIYTVPTMATAHKISRQYLYYQGPDFTKVSEAINPKEDFESKPEFDYRDFDSVLVYNKSMTKSKSHQVLPQSEPQEA